MILKRNFIRILLFCATAFVLLAVWMLFFAPEQYYMFDPYCDTQMAKGYSPERFMEVEQGMTQHQVESIIGTPLHKDTSDRSGTGTVYSYTSDGKLMDEQVPWYMHNDYAWYASEIVFDSLMRVKESRSGWVHD